MTRRQSREARTRRDRDRALLRDAVERGGSAYGTDRTIARLVAAGLVEQPKYAYGAAR